MGELNETATSEVAIAVIPVRSDGASKVRVTAFSRFSKNALVIRIANEVLEPLQVLLGHMIISVVAAIVIQVGSWALAFDGLGKRLMFPGLSVERWFFYLDVMSVTLILVVGIARCVSRMWKDGVR